MHGTPDGRTVPAYVGISEGSEDKPATLEEAIHDAAIQAVEGGHGEVPLNVVTIELVAHNPHIKAYKVVITASGP
jgi:hypothetical protein